MSSRSKGNEAEEKVCAELIADGWTVWRASSPRFFKPHSSADIFGLYDVVAAKGHKIRWIQVRSEPYLRTIMRKDILSLWLPGTREVWLQRKGQRVIHQFTDKDIESVIFQLLIKPSQR